MPQTPPLSLEAKLEYLRQPAAFPDAPASVETIETHFAWVFLSSRYVYKLKKPIRSHVVDFTNLHARRANCELEVTLNRRLAENVYIGVVPLSRAEDGLRLEGEGETVEWLVKMHRLPRHRMLDQAAARGMATPALLHGLVAKLTRFYSKAPRAPLGAADYRRRLDAQARRYARQLGESAPGLGALIERVRTRQQRFITQHAALLEARVAAGRVVDAHGDLRPEHVYLAAPPQIIDCLEFSTELRWLDTAEEMAFLVLECDRLGHAGVGVELMELYAELAEDPAPAGLVGFYRSQRAVVRALLCSWHVQGDEPAEVAAHWRDRARWYLETATSSLE